MNPELEPYLQATIESSNRSRYITFVITFISMIIFGGYWNSLEFSWFKTANDVNGCLRLYISFAENINKDLTEPKKTAQNGKIEIQKADTHPAIFRELVKSKFKEIYPKRFGKCEKYIHTALTNEIYSFRQDLIEIEKISIQEKARYYHQSYIDNVGTVSAHFFHENFHINDLALFSGTSFCILVSILLFSYRTEMRNLKIFFVLSRKLDSLNDGYQVLAMHQVLTITPSLEPDKSEAVERIGKMIPKFLFLIPLLLEILIMFDIFLTYKSVIEYNDTATMINVSFGLLFAGMVAVLTVFCFVISIQIDQLWQDTAEQIRNQQK
ncbi:MAG TPA: hypothetical protein PL048_00685 [Leptospiraceae bacterium]|nr:hypothetical protein [Leptospiraceae bacterium]HNC00544.1 hypothetical protein [Leptospiraceae bacterium]HNF16166.1 hypothetical protein [Leptospiraceae bacterium]HNF24622.1 hypothetical protein [Leptospiraceae bacterium]HNI95026.1 hypothetical protein [Leptospiraceae bacterium]